ncbi:MAG: hypothetical protein RH917_00055 [Lacipirellulaceae bacterium]
MKPRSTTATVTAGISPARTLPVLARLPRVGAAEPAKSQTLVAAFELPPVEIAPLVEAAAAKPQAEVKLPPRKQSDFVSKRIQEPDHKVTLASRLFRFHEAIAPHSGFVMAATLLVAGGLLMWINSTGDQPGGYDPTSFAFSSQGKNQPQWVSNSTESPSGSCNLDESDSVEPVCSDEVPLDRFAAEQKPQQLDALPDSSQAPPLLAPAEGGYHSTGFASDYLSAIHSETNMAKRPTQETR